MKKNSIIYILGIIVLLLIFAVAYQLVSKVGTLDTSEVLESVAGFSSDSQTIGETGGFHYIREGRVENKENYQRFILKTELNRESVIEDSINTPYSTATLISRNGETYIELSLSSTTRTYSEEGTHEDIYNGIDGAVDMEGPIDRVDVLPGGESAQLVHIFVNDTDTKFRLSTDPENSGILWLDVLL